MTKTQLFILGAGIQFPTHLTVETIEALSECKAVYSNLPQELLSLLPEGISDKSVSLWPLYKDRRRRVENYQDVINKVLYETESVGSVAWLTRGHPVVFDSVTTALIRHGRSHKWAVRVKPAISSIDTTLAELAYEPAGGLMILEATGLVRRQVRLNPDMATLLFQPSAFNTEFAHLTRESLEVNLAPLQEYLSQFFPSEHPCAFVFSPERASNEGRTTWVHLIDLAHTEVDAIAGSSLFVPPLGWSPEIN